MSTKQALFVRSYKVQEESSHGHKENNESDGESVSSSHSTSSLTRHTALDDDQETVLDISENLEPRDESGKRTYERACHKVGVTPVSNCLRKLETCRDLDLQYYGLGPKSVIPVAMALVINSSITRLNLESNALGSEGVVHIQRMMEGNCTITDINLAGNSLQTVGAHCVASMLSNNKTLISLNLADNGFVQTDALPLAKAVQTHSRLAVVNFSHNSFGDQSAISLSRMLENSCLQEVDLSWNHFRRKGVQILCKGLAENISVKVLNLSWNGCEDDGASAMGKTLSHNTKLQDVDLSCNRISSQGLLQLLKGLSQNHTLDALKVGKNSISETGAEMALNLLTKMSNISLKHLDLSDVILGNSIIPHLEELQAVHPDLKVTYGYSDTYGKRKLRSQDVFTEAVEIIQEYCQHQGMMLVEMFAKFAAGRRLTVPRSEFIEGLKTFKVPLSSLHVDKLIESLGSEDSGHVDLSELVMSTGPKNLR